MERQCKGQGKVKARQLERQWKGNAKARGRLRQDSWKGRGKAPNFRNGDRTVVELEALPGSQACRPGAVVASQTAGKQERNRIESFKYFAAEIMSTVTIQRLAMCCDAGLRHGQQARIPAGLWTASQTALSAAGPRKTAPSA